MRATLRISGPDLIESEINQSMGIEGSEFDILHSSDSAGQSFESRLWCLSAPEDPELSLEEQINWIIEHVAQDERVWKILLDKCEVDIFCGFFMGKRNEGIELSPETMEWLGRRGIVLGFDIYAPEE